MTSELGENWQRYWHDLPSAPGTAIWDSDPSVTVARDLPLFETSFTPGLPLLDLGCGNGTQTQFLGERFTQVIGLDVAEAAVELAKRTHPADGVQYRQFDLLNRDESQALRGELGDVNIYLRNVIHQLPQGDRPAAIASLAILLGATGRLFMIELAPSAKETNQHALASAPDSVPKLRRVLAHGIAPAKLDTGELERLLTDAGLRVFDNGTSTLVTTDRLPDGAEFTVPLQYVIAGRRAALS